ncbi:MAG: S9 family peptidase [Pseudomonadota bacterium]
MRFIIAATAALLANGAHAEPFAPADVFELEVARDPQVSPDGGQITYVRQSNDIMTDRSRSNVWIVSADGTSHRPVLSGKDNYRSPRWSPNGDRLAYVTSAEGGDPQLYVRWMDTGQTALLTNLNEAPGSIAWAPDGQSIAFTMFVPGKAESLASLPDKPDGAKWAEPAKVIDDVTYRADGAGFTEDGFTHVFVVPAEGGTPRQLTSGDYDHDSSLAWSSDSETIYFAANRNDDWNLDLNESEIWSVSRADGEMTALTDRDGPDFAPHISPDGRQIAFLGYDDKRLGYHTTQVHVMNLDSGDRAALAEDLDRSIDDLAWADDGSLIIQYDDRGRTYLSRLTLDGVITPLVRDVGGTTLGRPYTSGGFDVRSGVIAYTSGRAERPSDIAVRPLDGRAARLTRLNDDLMSTRTMGDVERITWKSSADGRDIEGWLVKPVDFDETKKYPLILEIHGGPFAAYGPQFSSEVQLFASAGYVVLYANPRGSTSYGAEFANLIHHAYPGQDYDDLMSGVDAAIATGYVDPENLFVTGGSGGGVLTAWIIGKTERFKAAVVAKPVINWTSFVLTADFYPFFTKYWFDKAPWEDPMAYWERSPLSLVGEVATPTMLLTGEADYRTPMSETEQYYQALKLREIDTVMVRIPDAPHFIAGRPSNLISKVAHILAWFDKYRTDKDDDDAE